MADTDIARNPVIGLIEHLGDMVEVEVMNGTTFKGIVNSADKFNNAILSNVSSDSEPTSSSVFIRGTHIVTITI